LVSKCGQFMGVGPATGLQSRGGCGQFTSLSYQNGRLQMRFIFSLLPMLPLAFTFIMPVVDPSQVAATSAVRFSSRGTSLKNTFPGMLGGVQAFLNDYGAGMLWDPVILTILDLPGWLVFAAISLIFYSIGMSFRKRKPFAHAFR